VDFDKNHPALAYQRTKKRRLELSNRLYQMSQTVLTKRDMEKESSTTKQFVKKICPPLGCLTHSYCLSNYANKIKFISYFANFPILSDFLSLFSYFLHFSFCTIIYVITVDSHQIWVVFLFPFIFSFCQLTHVHSFYSCWREDWELCPAFSEMPTPVGDWRRIL